MAKISLRDYRKGIEELIDHGQTEEALAHCRHILAHFSKNVATYQLMGKAYLEAHQHSAASDIFQRVLSSSPDDFISHLGMSIIREEAGDLNGSIWNMERAFEAQPSNRAVQDELRRLYGKREGFAPPKVRLTRGALARMYAHGDLYNQAIGELRAALAEDQARPDLQILLAEMYYMTKRQTEAVEELSKLLGKLPYCLQANRLMVDILRGSHRDLEAKLYLERVEELDPYAALVDTRTPVESAPAESIMLEQLVYEKPIEKEQIIPQAWTGSLESQPSEFEKEDLPEWLSVENGGELDEKKVQEAPQEPLGLPAPLEDVKPIPDSELETPKQKSPGGPSPDDQVPDWLKDLRPTTTSFAADEKDLLPEPEPERPIEAEPTNLEPAFDLQSGELTGEPTASRPLPEDDESLGWLENLAAQQGAPEDELLTTPETRQSAKPEWLPEEKHEEERDVLAWLDEMAAEKVQEPFEPVVEEAPISQPAEEISPLSSEDNEKSSTTPSWLKELSSEVDKTPSISLGEPEQISPRPLEEAPDWLSELRPSTDEIKDAETASEEAETSVSEELSPAEGPGRLDWLVEMGPPKTIPEQPVKGDWQLETPPVTQEVAGESTPLSVPEVSPRRTAALLAEQQAPARLEKARQALNYGKLNEAADHYGYLLHRRLLIPEVIADVDAAVHRHPGDATLWQILGDAYMRNNQLREALDCYTRAEDLL